MCGIIGYAGHRPAVPVIIEGLRRLEYRGYDSAGVGFIQGKELKVIKAEGKLIVIDGGFCRAYHQKTGIAGYTLIYNSYGLRLSAHEPFDSIEKAIEERSDIHSNVTVFETSESRIKVGETDIGRRLREKIADLKELLRCYRSEDRLCEERRPEK